MKKILIALTLSLALAAPTAASAQSRNKELFGTLGGAALGGFLGSQIGSGKGRLAATGAGVLLGGLLGNQVGRSLDSYAEALRRSGRGAEADKLADRARAIRAKYAGQD